METFRSVKFVVATRREPDACIDQPGFFAPTASNTARLRYQAVCQNI